MSNKQHNEQLKFASMLEDIFNRILQGYLQESMNRDTLARIRNDMYVRLNEILSRCHFSLADKSVHWLSDEYFKQISFGTSDGRITLMQENLLHLDQPNIKDLPLSDIKVMSELFKITDFGDDLSRELRRRN